MDKITISRWQGTSGQKGVGIQIESNGYMLYRGDMTIENYGHLISGLANIPVDRDDRCLVDTFMKEREAKERIAVENNYCKNCNGTGFVMVLDLNSSSGKRLELCPKCTSSLLLTKETGV
jgi:hypothetical protein